MNIPKNLQIYKTEAFLFFVLTVVVLTAYFLFFQSSGQTVQKKEAQWSEARKTLEKVLRQKKVEQDLAKVISLLPDQQAYASVINAPMEIARRYHLTVPSVTYQKENIEQDLIRVSFSFSVMGTYEAIRQFISEIESAKSLYVIEDMNLGKSSKEGSVLELQLKMASFLKT
ncbi:MAG: type 4a pilus biogenesis protein PilO [Nitrospirae bacterium]|nr:type 4a pilus biogenesis protein PilO [Nitrospirota bacterium]